MTQSSVSPKNAVNAYSNQLNTNLSGSHRRDNTPKLVSEKLSERRTSYVSNGASCEQDSHRAK